MKHVGGGGSDETRCCDAIPRPDPSQRKYLRSMSKDESRKQWQMLDRAYEHGNSAVDALWKWSEEMVGEDVVRRCCDAVTGWYGCELWPWSVTAESELYCHG